MGFWYNFFRSLSLVGVGYIGVALLTGRETTETPKFKRSGESNFYKTMK